MELSLILGDQLFRCLSLPGDMVFMREDWGLCRRVRHHRQKLVLFLSGMRHYRRVLERQGRKVHYEDLVPHDEVDYWSSLGRFCRDRGVTLIHAYEPADRFFRAELVRFGDRVQIEIRFHPNPMFLTSEADWERYRKSSRRLLMGDFYRQRRLDLGILVEDGEPTGGRWSFDEDNRKKLPKGHVPPAVWNPAPDETTQQVIEMVDAVFTDHPGTASRFGYPVTHEAADHWLSQFLEDRLRLFGPYEDSLSLNERTVYHSILTPMLNTGLLTPREVVDKTLAFASQNEVPLNSLEGFIRQVIGWREFIFWVSGEYSEEIPNFFGHQRRLGPAWWSGSTGLPPLDLAIKRTIDHAWCHHIERLMVIGSAMLMAQVHPEDAYRWFMEMFIDSADWVMIPNVIGMSQFADGGTFATKPYLSGSAYLLKMGDYPKGEWCDVWDGLYWSFIDRNRGFFAKNPRMSTMVGGVDRLDPARRERIFNAADQWVRSVTTA